MWAPWIYRASRRGEEDGPEDLQFCRQEACFKHVFSSVSPPFIQLQRRWISSSWRLDRLRHLQLAAPLCHGQLWLFAIEATTFSLEKPLCCIRNSGQIASR